MSSEPRSLPTPATTSPVSGRSSTVPEPAELQRLDASVLTALVGQVGLADAAEIVRHTTTAQLTDLLDEELWRSDRPGADERFDVAAFSTWLEVMAEIGAEETAARLGELPEDLLRLGVLALAMVFDREALVLAAREDGGELVDKALEGALTLDVGPFLVVSRGVDGWDALVDALLAWAEVDGDRCEALLETCSAATADEVDEAGGLHEVLTAAETVLEDAIADRERRRARRGFVAPWTARSFLALAREQDVEEVLEELGRDPVTRACFREMGGARAVGPRRPAPRASGEALAPTCRPGAPAYEVALAALGLVDPHEASARVEELAYLVNVLCSGCSRGGERFSADEALRAAFATCSVGLEVLLERAPTGRDLAMRIHADILFRIGWGTVHARLARPARRLLRAVAAGSELHDALRLLSAECPLVAAPLSSNGPTYVDRLTTVEQVEDRLRALRATTVRRGA